MSRHMSLVCGALCLLASSSTASAQFYGSPGDACGCVQPVAQPCYQTVPVTEMRQIRQVVQRPVHETKYVEQQVTRYEPVTETRTASVPTVSYENVTEMQTQCRDCGYWQTTQVCNNRVSPCQYDSRPGFLGWLNRTGYSMRSAVTPRVTTRRQYIPQTVAYQVPITRQVARHGTREVAYNVTRMVARTETQQVAVNTVRYEAEERVINQPVTVMRTVPIGSATAFLPSAGAPTTALAPVADPNVPRSADSSSGEAFKRDATLIKPKSADEFDKERTSYVPEQEQISISSNVKYLDVTPTQVHSRTAAKVPSVVRVSRWTPVRSANAGPTLASPAISVADSAR